MDLLSAAAQVALPVAVSTIMFCLGLGLEQADFKRLLRQPRLLGTAIPCQLLLLPLLALLLSYGLELSPPLAAGLMLVATCPVSAPASLLARLAHTNVAGSLTLTALTAPAAAVTIPLALSLTGYEPPGAGGAGRASAGGAALWRISFGVPLLAALPVAVGMLVRAFAPAWTRRVERSAVRVAVVAFVIGLALAIASCWTQIPGSFRQVGLAALLLNILGVGAAYAVARVAGVTSTERVVVMLGTTTRQFAVAGFVALTLLGDAQLLMPAIAYCLIMWLAAGASVLLARLAFAPGPASVEIPA